MGEIKRELQEAGVTLESVVSMLSMSSLPYGRSLLMYRRDGDAELHSFTMNAPIDTVIRALGTMEHFQSSAKANMLPPHDPTLN